MVKSKKYIPDTGDIVWLNFNPVFGHKQSGRRPALTLSPKLYNEKTGLALFCPITSKIKGYSFEVNIPDNKFVNGVILSDQIKSFDWTSRNAEYIFKVLDSTIKETMGKIRALLKY